MLHYHSIVRWAIQVQWAEPLVILVIEILSTTLKNDPTISGIKFNDSEYLASQYADDTSLTLEDDPVSLERCLQIFNKVGDCAGLRANLDKT